MKILVVHNAESITDILEFGQAQIGSQRWRKVVHMVILAALWRLWLARNDKEFNDVMVPVTRIVEYIKEDSYMWMKNRVLGGSLEWSRWIEFDISMYV
ncbi:hypothetical protein HanRHA438_Chr05g0209541 [Helianthus annuus]|nr:hypothetical protein HanHA300_Chr05g0164001 [Helianthus annuus]KAJ0575696.1 hypothetical protein HanIR_Chr05g0215701 [Helianthus annuus]KAJ0583562.1 hypothetical protein HanHA89_Chr05g0178041 [Helianthus annuus]KAJ0749293.1 hypothetical protein HanLR1_Chr05g0168171 [Helianthus annuus]KAJ0917748.1 hypothetical protein HanRHA438_Chr05g0209541 [Helianthus annuus]